MCLKKQWTGKSILFRQRPRVRFRCGASYSCPIHPWPSRSEQALRVPQQQQQQLTNRKERGKEAYRMIGANRSSDRGWRVCPTFMRVSPLGRLFRIFLRLPCPTQPTETFLSGERPSRNESPREKGCGGKRQGAKRCDTYYKRTGLR
jgi:hypothetical protein